MDRLQAESQKIELEYDQDMVTTKSKHETLEKKKKNQIKDLEYERNEEISK